MLRKKAPIILPLAVLLAAVFVRNTCAQGFFESNVPGTQSSQTTPQPPPPPELLDDSCIVAVLNRTTSVAADGSWILPNVPANFGPIRARANCVKNGVSTFGQSDLFTLTADQALTLPAITLGTVTPIPLSINLSAAVTTLTQTGQQTQLAAVANFAGGGTQTITASSSGTQYRTSNPAIASVTAEGLVTAVSSGTAIIQALNEGAQGLFKLQVTLSVDSDGDHIPDDAELRLGLNPHDPTDASLDRDHDGLTNLQEFQLGTDILNPDTDGDGLTDGQEVLLYHTNPLVVDTDGDGIPDGIEVQAGSDPANPASINLSRALSSLEINPSRFLLTVNSLNSQASQQLAVLGHLIDGKTTIDLTSTQKGTVYTSSDLTICNFGSPDGNVFAGAAGICTITVTNAGFTATSNGTVIGFTPVPLSVINIPGYANNVDVNGNFAYVAAGSAGLQIVDVSDRSHPRIVSALPTPGNANDVKVVGTRAYIADGSGLRIVDVSNPLAPRMLGGLSTPAPSWDVSIAGTLAYVADDSAGVQVIDVTNPATPVILGSIALPGVIKGIEIDSTRNLVAAVGTAGLFTIDVTNPGAPALLGAVNYGGDPRDVALQGNFAFAADFSKSLSLVDLTNPAAPAYRASTDLTLGGRLQDVAISGNFALGADVVFVNGVPITDISRPPALLSRAILNFPFGQQGFRDDNGTGIAADGAYVYLTAAADTGTENGTTGDTRLYIGQFNTTQDNLGVAPTVRISSPVSGTTLFQGQQVQIAAQASDDVGVAVVNLQVNGQTVFSSTSPPYQFLLTIPANGPTLTIGAQAIDFGSNIGTAVPVVINAVPDPLTTAHGRVVDAQNNAISGITVNCQNKSAVSGPDGSFSVAGLSTLQGAIQCSAANSSGTAKSLPMTAVRGGATEVGVIALSLSRSRGRDFWLVCPYGGQNGDATVVCEIFILSDGSANYSVTTDPSFNFGASGTVTAQSPAVINVPRLLPVGCTLDCSQFGLQLQPFSGFVENKAIHVTADADISVFLFIPEISGSDMYAAIPTVSLGKQYAPILAANSIPPVYVTATQDNTHVTVVCSRFTTLSSPALTTGQTYDAECPLPADQAQFSSDLPVSVVVGYSGPSGPVTEMMLPVDGLTGSTEIYSAPLPVGATDSYEIRPLQDGTTVTVDQGGGNVQTIVLDHDQYYPLQFKSGARFTSDKPMVVAQFFSSCVFCGGVGIAEMQLLPTSNFGKSFRFYTPADDPVAAQFGYPLLSRFAIIIAPNAGIGSVQLNGAAVNGFTPLPGGTYQYAVVPVPQGQNVVTSTQPITVYSVGFGSGAYATPTGF